MKQERDHIFISYATEQSALCDWLARRLAAEGYGVWYDRLKLLGGENWPTDIDEAINARTFRMLALLSQASMRKPNPQGEWLKGRAIGRQLGNEDFVIPLNTEGLRPEEITWNLQPINYIPFYPSWAEGLAALLKKLHSVGAPRVLDDGRRVAVASIVGTSAVSEEPEELMSNCFEVLQTPRYIRKYEAERNLSRGERGALRREWACRDVSDRRVLAFEDPPSAVDARNRFQYMGSVLWRDTAEVYGIDTRDLVVNLIHRCLDCLLRGVGMEYSIAVEPEREGDRRSRSSRRNRRNSGKRPGQWYLPRGLLNNDRVSFTFPDGSKRRFSGVGERTYPTKDGGEGYRYHLSPSFSVLKDTIDPFVLLLRNRVYLTDTHGTPLKKQKILSRRKHLCKTWFNKEWAARTLGIAQLLADEDSSIRFGPEGEQQLVVSAMPIIPTAPLRIRDDLVDEPDEAYTAWYWEDDAGIEEPEAD